MQNSQKTPVPESPLQQSCRPEARNPTKKEALTQAFLCEFCKIPPFTEHPRTTASARRNPILLHFLTPPCTTNPPPSLYIHPHQSLPSLYTYPHPASSPATVWIPAFASCKLLERLVPLEFTESVLGINKIFNSFIMEAVII